MKESLDLGSQLHTSDRFTFLSCGFSICTWCLLRGLAEGLHVIMLIKHLARCMADSQYVIPFITLGFTTREGHLKADVEGQEAGTGESKAESGMIS